MYTPVPELPTSIPGKGATRGSFHMFLSSAEEQNDLASPIGMGIGSCLPKTRAEVFLVKGMEGKVL